MTEWGSLDEFRPLLFPQAGWILVLLAAGGLVDITSGRLGRRLRERLAPGRRFILILVLWAIFLAASLFIGVSVIAMNRFLFWMFAGPLLVAGLLARLLGGPYPR